jgi:hypothetical protein
MMLDCNLYRKMPHGDEPFRLPTSALASLSTGPLIRHCLIGKRGPRVQALRVPYSHGYSPPPDSPYCAPGCRLLSSIIPCSASAASPAASAPMLAAIQEPNIFL